MRPQSNVRGYRTTAEAQAYVLGLTGTVEPSVAMLEDCDDDVAVLDAYEDGLRAATATSH